MKDKLKGAFISASVFLVTAALFEALDLDKLIDKFLPSINSLFEPKVSENPQQEGTEADAQIDSNTDFSAGDLEKDQP